MSRNPAGTRRKGVEDNQQLRDFTSELTLLYDFADADGWSKITGDDYTAEYVEGLGDEGAGSLKLTIPPSAGGTTLRLLKDGFSWDLTNISTILFANSIYNTNTFN